MKAIVVMLVVIFSVEARAADWVSVGKLKDGTQEAYVDVSSIRTAGSLRKALVRWVVDPPAIGSSQRASGRWQSSMVYQSEFNCARGTNHDYAVTIFYNDGTRYVGQMESASGKRWQLVPSGTPWKTAMQLICSYRSL
jgi:hypothetical protein